jgi:DsbC/DsbD-like thiol-disulfide interchange protein
MRHPSAALAAALALPLSAAGPALAADAASFRNEAVRLEMVMDAAPAAGEPLRGALLVDLQPGWTTYWRDPGEAGLAPALSFADGSGAPLAARWSQPAPLRLPEGDLFVNAYEGRTAFAVTFVPSPRLPERVSVDLLIGVCREICVPVSARLEAPVEPEPPLADRRAVRAAFAALPVPAAPGTVAVLPSKGDGGALRVSAAPVGDAPGELFVSSAPGWRFGPARREDAPDAAGRTVFAVPVTARPAGAPENVLPERIDIVLASGDKAVAAFDLPTR